MNNKVKYYLAAYNFTAFAFWLLYFVCFLGSLSGDAKFSPSTTGLLLLNIAQGMALLEILHTLLQWVKSPVMSTVAQVSSRILVLMLIDIYASQGTITGLAQAGLVIVSFAWSITEMVRYSFYFLGLFNRQPAWLLWMRYSFFIVLYPTGVTGEWLLIIAPVAASHYAISLYMGFTVFLLISYVYYFPVLYRYMWKQRRERVGK